MFKQKEHSMTFSKSFEILRPTYRFLKLTPATSIRNYNSSIIAKSIALTYKRNVINLFDNIRRYIKKEEEKVFYRSPSKISYYMYIEKNDVQFFFIVPEVHLSLIREKTGDVWKGITITQVDSIPILNADKSLYYQLHYKKEDGLSLATDKRSNSLLASQLNVLDFMEQNDKLSIMYNLIPCNQRGWKNEYKETMGKFNNRQPIDKEKSSGAYIIKKFFATVYEVLDVVMETFMEVVGENKKKEQNQSILEIALGLEKRELSKATVKKEDNIVLKNQIVVASESTDKYRKKNNAISLCQSFHCIGEDNSMEYKEIKGFKNKITDYKFDKVIENKMSVDEMQNFISLPGREILESHKCIDKIDVLEKDIPDELKDGYIRLGQTTVKGKVSTAYMCSDKNLANLGLTTLGPQGAGKTEYFKNYGYDVIKKGECLIILDFIKSCGLANAVKSVTPKELLKEVDLGRTEDLQGFGYNEIKFNPNMTAFEILETANLQMQQDMALIDAISEGAPLTSRMRRFLSAAANVVHIHENTSLRDVINVLEDFQIRHEYIDAIPASCKEYLQDEIRALSELDEYSKVTKENPVSEIIGTRESKIEHILDRINLLKEDFKLKYMFNKSLENNIDFVECMEQGKVILIKIPEFKYPLKYVKNILVTYFTTKIWLAAQIRGQMHDKPLRTHVIVDEIFQAPTSEKLLVNILPQCRKFQTKFVISAHYLSQIETIREALKASGSSYMLLQGTDKKNYRELEEELKPYELEDLLNLKRFHSLNLIKTSKGYASFVTKLPKPIE